MRALDICSRAWDSDRHDPATQRHLFVVANADPNEKATQVLCSLAVSPGLDPDLRTMLRHHRTDEVRHSAWTYGPIGPDELTELTSDTFGDGTRCAVLQRIVNDEQVEVARTLVTSCQMTKEMADTILDLTGRYPADVVRPALLSRARRRRLSAKIEARTLHLLADDDHLPWALTCEEIPLVRRLETVATAMLDSRRFTDPANAAALEDLVRTVAADMPTPRLLTHLADRAGLHADGPEAGWFTAPDTVLDALVALYRTLAAANPSYESGLAMVTCATELRSLPPARRLDAVTSEAHEWAFGLRLREAVLGVWEHIPTGERTFDQAVTICNTLGVRAVPDHVVEPWASEAAWALTDGTITFAPEQQLPAWSTVNPHAFLELLLTRDPSAAGIAAHTAEDAPPRVRAVLAESYLSDPHRWKNIPASAIKRMFHGLPDMVDRLPWNVTTAPSSSNAHRGLLAHLAAEIAAGVATAADPAHYLAALDSMEGSPVATGDVLAAARTASTG